MHDEVKTLLKKTRLFNVLDEKTLDEIASQFTKIDLQHQEVLFYQNDPSDSLYVLISGQLTAELTTTNGETRIVGHIEPGETVGELGV